MNNSGTNQRFQIIGMMIVLLAWMIPAQAQIPNSGFETWTTTGNYEHPIDWATMNQYSAGPFYSATKSTDHYPPTVGNYSIRVENNTSLGQFTGGFGMAITRAFDYPPIPAFPLVGSPTSLNGYYKYNSLNNDSMSIRIIFFQNGIMLGYNTFMSGTSTSDWTAFSLPLTYPTADSASVYISALWLSSPLSKAKGNSVLYVDNLSFHNLITSTPQQTVKTAEFSIYPNPDNHNIINVNLANPHQHVVTLNIYNVTGKQVKTELLRNNNRKINVKDLTNGLYLVEVKTPSGTGQQKLLIKK